MATLENTPALSSRPQKRGCISCYQGPTDTRLRKRPSVGRNPMTCLGPRYRTVCTTHAKTPGSQEKARYYQHYRQAIYYQRDKAATEGGVCNTGTVLHHAQVFPFFPLLHLIDPSDLQLHLTPPRFSVWVEWIAVELALRIECRDYTAGQAASVRSQENLRRKRERARNK